METAMLYNLILLWVPNQYSRRTSQLLLKGDHQRVQTLSRQFVNIGSIVWQSCPVQCILDGLLIIRTVDDNDTSTTKC